MRDYGKISPQFWTGTTGKAIKASGPEAVVVALYLMTSPHANMIGLYYLPKLYIAHETGLPFEGACKGLARCCEALFCTYDDASEHVFVHAMARFQIASSLKPEDNRVKGVENEVAKAPQGALLKAFMDIYAVQFSLKKTSPSKAPPKPRAGTGAGTGEETGTEAGSGITAPTPLPATPIETLAIGLPLNDGSDFPITEKHVAEFTDLYPAVDVMQELRSMRAWAISNPTKKKTKLGVMRFVNAWLSKEQDAPKRASKGSNLNNSLRELAT